MHHGEGRHGAPFDIQPRQSTDVHVHLPGFFLCCARLGA